MCNPFARNQRYTVCHMTRRIKILVVGQTPPPCHGQALMIERLVQARFERVELRHVRMAFSSSIADVGRFRVGKLWHLAGVIGRIVWQRIAHGVDVLYYPPVGPHRVPLYRDLAILCCTRWMFRKTIFHFHTLGIGRVYRQLPLPLRWLAQRSFVRRRCRDLRVGCRHRRCGVVGGTGNLRGRQWDRRQLFRFSFAAQLAAGKSCGMPGDVGIEHSR